MEQFNECNEKSKHKIHKRGGDILKVRKLLKKILLMPVINHGQAPGKSSPKRALRKTNQVK